MSDVLQFPPRPARKTRKRPTAIPAAVVNFPEHYPIAYAERVLFEGRKRLAWVCTVIDRPGGEPAYHWVKAERDARWLAGVFLQQFAEKRAFENDPLAVALRALPKDVQRGIGRWLIMRAKDEN